MKTLRKYEDLAVPSYALSYLVNNDATGLSDEDEAAIDAFMQPFYAEAKELGGHVLFCDDADCEPYFCRCPEFGLACDVIDCKVLILK